MSSVDPPTASPSVNSARENPKPDSLDSDYPDSSLNAAACAILQVVIPDEEDRFAAIIFAHSLNNILSNPSYGNQEKISMSRFLLRKDAKSDTPSADSIIVVANATLKDGRISSESLSTTLSIWASPSVSSDTLDAESYSSESLESRKVVSLNPDRLTDLSSFRVVAVLQDPGTVFDLTVEDFVNLAEDEVDEAIFKNYYESVFSSLIDTSTPFLSVSTSAVKPLASSPAPIEKTSLGFVLKTSSEQLKTFQDSGLSLSVLKVHGLSVLGYLPSVMQSASSARLLTAYKTFLNGVCSGLGEIVHLEPSVMLSMKASGALFLTNGAFSLSYDVFLPFTPKVVQRHAAVAVQLEKANTARALDSDRTAGTFIAQALTDKTDSIREVVRDCFLGDFLNYVIPFTQLLVCNDSPVLTSLQEMVPIAVSAMRKLNRYPGRSAALLNWFLDYFRAPLEEAIRRAALVACDMTDSNEDFACLDTFKPYNPSHDLRAAVSILNSHVPAVGLASNSPAIDSDGTRNVGGVSNDDKTGGIKRNPDSSGLAPDKSAKRPTRAAIRSLIASAFKSSLSKLGRKVFFNKCAVQVKSFYSKPGASVCFNDFLTGSCHSDCPFSESHRVFSDSEIQEWITYAKPKLSDV
jgi:hypothetical protein